MKFLATILVAAAFCLSSPLAARAEIALSIVNKTGHEIVYMRAQAGEASIGITPDIMPDTTFVFTQDSKITQLHFDSGRTFFAFDNVNIDSSVTLQLTYKDNVAVLLPEGQDPNEYFAALQEQADQTSISDKGNASTDESFDLEAGPIWNNDHAKEICPALVKQWMQENPGKEAEWTGAWTTTVAHEMSVCNVRVKAQASVAPAPDAPAAAPGAPAGTYVGTATDLIQTEGQVSLEALLAARDADAVRALGAVPSYRGERALLLPVGFGEINWAAFVHTDRDGAVTAIQFYAAISQDTEISSCLKALSAMDYRPWYTEVREGQDMTLKGATRYWNDSSLANREFAENLLEKACNETYSRTTPIATQTVFLPATAWERAADGEDVETPCIRLRVTPAENLILTYHHAGSPIVALTRE